MKFTQTNVTTLKPPPGKKDHWEPDEGLPGFGIRFRNGGAGIYGLRYSFAGRDRRLAFKAVNKVKLTDAKTWAMDQHATIAHKVDPAVERAKAQAKASARGFKDMIDPFLDYLAVADGGRAPSYIAEVSRSLKNYFKSLHHYTAPDITRAAVAAELLKIKTGRGPIAADRSRAHLSCYFGWLIAEGAADFNPVQGTNRNGGKPRDRVLNDDEVKAIWHAVGDGTYGSILKLLILTGCRASEIGDLRRDEVNLKDRQLELPGSRVKNKLDYIVPLSSLAMEIIQKRMQSTHGRLVFGHDRGNGFADWPRAKRELDKKLAIPPWVVHDFRRTLSTNMHERLRIQPHIVEAVINHISGHKRGVAGVYNKATYAAEKRAALEAYATYIATIVE
jgi:integrase